MAHPPANQYLLRTVLCAVLGLATAGMRAQVGEMRSFEVASVRLTSPDIRATERITDTRVDLTRITLRQLLWMAFYIDPFHSGDRLSAPGWAAQVTVDVHATIPTGGTRVHVPEMIRSLLVERFGLRTHVAPRPTEVYELAIGKGGIRMQEAQPANDLETKFPVDTSAMKSSRDITTETVQGPVRSIVTSRGRLTITERSMYERTVAGQGTTAIDATRITMPEFASLLAANLGRPVIDRTGLTALYRFRIQLPRDAYLTRGQAVVGAMTGRSTGLDEPTGVSTFKAVEKLGLTLESRRVAMDTIVVDQLERVPREN